MIDGDEARAVSESKRYAVLIDGPRWWGERWSMPDGSPCFTRTDAAAAREVSSEDEARGLQIELERLPATCQVIHTGALGAATRAARWAAQTSRVVAVVPALPARRETEFVRNALAVDLLAGLRAIGYDVKALVCQAPEVPYLGFRPADEETADLLARLKDNDVFCKLVHPVSAPAEPAAEPVGQTGNV